MYEINKQENNIMRTNPRTCNGVIQQVEHMLHTNEAINNQRKCIILTPGFDRPAPPLFPPPRPSVGILFSFLAN